MTKRKSVFGGTYRKPKRVHTVSELIAELQQLPSDLPVGEENGVLPIWFNIGRDPKLAGGCNGEHLVIDEHLEWEDDE